MAKTVIKLIQENYTIRGEKFKITAKARFDAESGEQLFDESLDNLAIQQAFNVYREKHHHIMPAEITSLRQKLGLTRNDFASLFHWSLTKLAIYEAGALLSEEDNGLLKVLAALTDR